METSAKQNGWQCRAQRVSAEAVPSTSGRKRNTERTEQLDSLVKGKKHFQNKSRMQVTCEAPP
jgi:hypothetical protein